MWQWSAMKKLRWELIHLIYPKSRELFQYWHTIVNPDSYLSLLTMFVFYHFCVIKRKKKIRIYCMSWHIAEDIFKGVWSWVMIITAQKTEKIICPSLTQREDASTIFVSFLFLDLSHVYFLEIEKISHFSLNKRIYLHFKTLFSLHEILETRR